MLVFAARLVNVGSRTESKEKDRHCNSLFPLGRMKYTSLNRLQRNVSDLRAMPGLGRSPYGGAESSSSDRTMYQGPVCACSATRSLKKKKGIDLELQCLSFPVVVNPYPNSNNSLVAFAAIS